MRIDSTNNFTTGNRAMASVLLLYFHLLQERGITNDQTVYVNFDDFDAFAFLTVEVYEQGSEIDQSLLREGAVIHLLCDLNDVVGEYENDFLAQPLIRRIIAANTEGKFAAIPEAIDIIEMVSAGESQLKVYLLAERLKHVYQKYVLSRFRALVHCGEA